MVRLRQVLVLVMIGLVSPSAFAVVGDAFEVTLEPNPPQVGVELFVRFTNIPEQCAPPIPAAYNTQRVASELQTFVNSSDEVFCPSKTESARYSLGVLPAGVTSLSIFGCGFAPPGVYVCGSSPGWQLFFEDIFSNGFD